MALSDEGTELPAEADSTTDSELKHGFDSVGDSVNTQGMDDPRNKAMGSQETRDYIGSLNLPEQHTQGMDFNYDGKYVAQDDGNGNMQQKMGESHSDGRVDVHAQNADGTATDRMQMENTIKHEIGHNVYDHMDKDDQEDWNAEAAKHHGPWKSEDAEDGAAYVMENDGDINEALAEAGKDGSDVHRAHEEIQEDFANTYRNYLNGDLDESDWRYQFMHDRVFEK
jgi:hypothetical protein